MDKIKKLGLTALAGSMVATSVTAADLSVTGGWSWSWDSTKAGVGNPMSMGNSVTFSASGETHQGWGVTANWELDDGYSGFDDQWLTLDFGDGGVFQYGGASKGGRGIGLVSNLIPSADSAVYTLSATDGDEYGVARGASGNNNLSHQITVGDIKIGAEIQKGAGTSTSLGVEYTGIKNLTLGIGTSDIDPTSSAGYDSDTVGASYKINNLTLAYQITEVDTSNDEDAKMYGVSYLVNPDFEISYGRQTVEIQGAADDEINSGFSASYTMGSMSFVGYVNKTESIAGASASNEEKKGITLSIDF